MRFLATTEKVGNVSLWEDPDLGKVLIDCDPSLDSMDPDKVLEWEYFISKRKLELTPPRGGLGTQEALLLAKLETTG